MHEYHHHPSIYRLSNTTNAFIIKVFGTIVFIFIVISTTFQPICPPAFFRCLSNSGTFMELQTTSFIETTGVACSDSVSHNWVQLLSIPVLLLACSEDWTCNLQMIVSLEAQGTNAYNRYCWTIQSEFLGIINLMFLLLARITTIMYDFLPVLIFRFFFFFGLLV